jgi:outer membrane immunogenic protein
MRKLIIITALAAAGIAAPAMAQDSGSFTGFRVEGLVGWDRVQKSGGHGDGVAYGVGAGYDFQTGGAVLGIEGEAGDSSVNRCTAGIVTPGDRLCLDAGRDLYVGGRVGGVVGNSTLLYAKGGYTNARMRATFNDGLAGAGNFSIGRDLDGYRIGGGVEQRIGSNTYLKAEYRYSHYQDGFARHQVLGGFGFRF